MKSFRLFFLVTLIFIFSQTASSQRTFGGTVVEVIDGKTAVVEIQSNRKLTVVLQFVEIPEPEQPLYGTVKEHLAKLILGRDVQILPRGVSATRTVGQLFTGGIDVSLQMLRDGAAWYAVLEKSGQSAAEREIYQDHESQAKTEKRGIWSFSDMKPPWEFRVEKEERERAAEIARLEEIKARARAESAAKPKRVASRPLRQTDYNLDLWGSMNQTGVTDAGGLEGFGGLKSGSLPKFKIGYVMTVPGMMKPLENNAPEKLRFQAVYLFKEYSDKDPSAFLVAFESEAGEYKFEQADNLSVIADKQVVNVGKAVRLHRVMDAKRQELLLFKVERSLIAKIAEAKNLTFKIGKYSATLNGNYQETVKNLLNASQ